MRFYLSPDAVLRHLEAAYVYHVRNDELYELDSEGLEFLGECSALGGADIAPNGFTDYALGEGLIVTEPVDRRRPRVVQAPTVPTLRYLELQITGRCNLRCRHCYLGQPEAVDMPPADLWAVLSQFEAMQGLRVLISGGEPLMHPEFERINGMLADLALRFVLLTNGTLLGDHDLSRLNVHEIQFSIDGIGASHDALRGDGNYALTMRALGAALQQGIQCSVSTMIHAHNLGEFDRMQLIFREMGVREWAVDVPSGLGNLADDGGRLVPTPDVAGRYLSFGYGGGMHGGAEGYACGSHLMAVTPRADCAKCSFYADEPVGNALLDGLAACWGRVRHLRLDELDCDCGHVEECCGGCRVRATSTIGNPLAKDLYRCPLYC